MLESEYLIDFHQVVLARLVGKLITLVPIISRLALELAGKSSNGCLLIKCPC